ncbi:MAG: CDP-diacylglycerol--glycerol-3-phosphate 3-phosphatidyltransferase [Fidelibacterota bacterium]
MNIPNLLTILRILLTPVFIIFLFYEHPYAQLWALLVFVIASVTDAFDGYYARKHDLVTESGRFLDPLADKILVTSAFISFAYMGIIEYWMVVLIIFRDLFVTGLRMAMSHKGFSLLTSKIAKAKTGTQIGIIIFILLFLGIRNINLDMVKTVIHFLRQYQFVYYLSLFVTLFTVYTGITYIYDNRAEIRQFLS